MRLFIALDLPARIKRALEDLQQDVPGANWTATENMHITLRFVGDVSNAAAEELDHELVRIDQPSFELMPDSVGQFSNGRGVKSIWAGLAPQEPLLELQAKVERACRRAGFAADRQTYKPHITLARFRDPPPLEPVRAFLERNGGFRRESYRVSGFSAYSSTLRPDGPIYRLEADYPFSDAGLGISPYFGDWDEDGDDAQISAAD